MSILKSLSITLCLFVFIFFINIGPANAQKVVLQKTTLWHGFEKVNFVLDGVPAYYVKPKKELAGNPWVWRAHFPNWHITMDSLLLGKGFYIAYINTNNQYGAPGAMMVWNKFYHYLTTRLSFAHKVALEGVSRGGLYVYGWAKRNPDKVSCIYAEAPVCDIKSWPGGKEKSQGNASNWKQLLQVYGFTESQAMQYQDNPIDHLADLAAFKVPILHVINLQDKIVPPGENTFVLVKRYLHLGGPAMVYPMTRGKQELNGHHFAIEHPDWWADFIERCSYPVKNPLPYHDFFKIRNGLSHFYGKLKRHQPVTVAFLGGSITYNPGWRDDLCKYLRERFPTEQFHFIAAGIPSLGSLPHAFRLQRDVLDSGKVDLMFVEAAVNDRVNGTDSITQVRDLEGIVRHAKRSNPDMDIAFFSFADPAKLADYSEGKIPVAVHNHELVAQHYGLPSLNLAREVYDKIKAGEFSWQYDFKSLHPAPYGETLYFESMKALLDSCFEKAGTAYSNKLPEPMNKFSFDNGQYYPIQKARIKSGWKLIDHWHPEDQTHTREGFVDVPVLEATVPGSELKLSFTGTAIGMAVLAGPYAGIIEYSIDKKPFQKLDLYTQWSSNLYLPWYELFSGTLKNKNHTLRLRLSPDQNPQSKGPACKIVYFLVNKRA
ncbi:MAG TPA: GDSL-type esterase/lipase family protein [Chitinophagaceae bacterium]|nr:GDSL-type esterase/lipase family protein [Chitinophagaceae bacterium]